MEDWGKFAAIVAVATIPVYASPLVLGPLFGRLKDSWTRFSHRNTRCRAVSWIDLPRDAVRQLSPPLGAGLGANNAFLDGNTPDSPYISALARLLYTVWGAIPKPVPRPEYLNVTKEYLRIEADVLVAMLLMHRSGSGSLTGHGVAHPGTTCTLHLGDSAIQLHYIENEYGSYTIGTIHGPPIFDLATTGVRGINKCDLRAIADGYPPFYRRLLWTNSNGEVAHPIQSMRDIHRAGWVLAIGFSQTPPVRLHRTEKKPAYEQACGRVLDMLTLLQGEYALHSNRKALLDAAVKVVTFMNGYRTGSGAPALAPIAFKGNASDIGRRMTVPQLRFALDLFNNYRETSLTADELEKLEGILEDVVRAAVWGVFTWWQYVNNHGHEFPRWLLDDRVRLNPIWITDA